MKFLVSISVLLASFSTVAGTSASDLHVLIYETDAEHKTILEEQAANIPGITAVVVGQGSTFEGFGSKYEAIVPALRKMDANLLVVVSDSRDVLINHRWISQEVGASGSTTTGQDFQRTFEVLTAHSPGAIIASAEAQCCVSALTYAIPGDYFGVDGKRKGRACSSGKAPCLWNGDDKVIPWENFMNDLAMSKASKGKDTYLNAGLIAGKAGDLLRVIETADIEVYEDDQAVLTDYMYRRPHELILDYNQLLFGNNRHMEHGCVFQDETEDKRLIHRETGATPLFIHSPGGYVSCHESLASRLGVKLHSSADERRLLQDWKRDLQNYAPNYGPIKTPVAPPLKVPTKAPTVAPTNEPTASPTEAPTDCGLFGLNVFCPKKGQCGFWRRLWSKRGC